MLLRLDASCPAAGSMYFPTDLVPDIRLRSFDYEEENVVTSMNIDSADSGNINQTIIISAHF